MNTYRNTVVIIVTLFLFVLACRSPKNIRICSYAGIHSGESKLSFHEVELYNTVSLRMMKDSLCRDSSLSYYKCQLNQKYSLEHHFLSKAGRLYNSNMDSLFVFGKGFAIQELIPTKIIPYVFKAYEFETTNKKKYLLLYVRDESINGTNYLNWNLLFDVTSSGKQVFCIPLSLPNQFTSTGDPNFYSLYPDYFGDFNNDSIVDLAFIKNDSILAYTIKNNLPQLLPDHFILLSSKPDINRWEIIDYSHWFNGISTDRQPADSCTFQFIFPDYTKALYIDK